MKLKDLHSALSSKGYALIRSNGHRVYSNGVNRFIVPHHSTVNFMIAKQILKKIGA